MIHTFRIEKYYQDFDRFGARLIRCGPGGAILISFGKINRHSALPYEFKWSGEEGDYE